MKNIIILLTLILCIGNVSAQDKAFTVMAVQGTAMCNGKNISPGQQLNADASVVVNPSSYVGLLHKSGKSLELKTKGSYPLRSYHDKLSVTGKGFQEKYVDYVVNGLNDKGAAYQKNMAVTGSVERGFMENDILIPIQDKSLLLEPNFIVEWQDNTTSKPVYDVVLKNMKEETVFRTRTTDRSQIVDLSSIELEENQYYLLSINDIANKRKSNIVSLYIPGGEERAVLDAELSAVKNSLDLNSAVGQMALAEIYKSKKLYLNALQAYHRATEISPEIEFYTGAYNNFVVTMLDEE